MTRLWKALQAACRWLDALSAARHAWESGDYDPLMPDD